MIPGPLLDRDGDHAQAGSADDKKYLQLWNPVKMGTVQYHHSLMVHGHKARIHVGGATSAGHQSR